MPILVESEDEGEEDHSDDGEGDGGLRMWTEWLRTDIPKPKPSVVLQLGVLSLASSVEAESLPKSPFRPFGMVCTIGTATHFMDSQVFGAGVLASTHRTHHLESSCPLSLSLALSLAFPLSLEETTHSWRREGFTAPDTSFTSGGGSGVGGR